MRRDEYDDPAAAEAFHTRLRDHLFSAGLPTRPAGLSRHIEERTGVSIHRATLSRFLNKRILIPSDRTVAALANAASLSATDRSELERLAAVASGRLGHGGGYLDVAAQLLAESAPDEGRLVDEESIRWEYLVGSDERDDLCREIRRTPTGSNGMRLAGISIGQVGTLGWELYDLGHLKLAASASNSAGPIGISIYPWAVRPRRNQHGLLVRFSDPSPNDVITWLVQYAWPGLWRSLRQRGCARGTLGSLRGAREITVRVVTKDPSLQPLRLTPGSRIGTLRGVTSGVALGDRWMEASGVDWIINRPPDNISFEVTTPRFESMSSVAS